MFNPLSVHGTHDPFVLQNVFKSKPLMTPNDFSEPRFSHAMMNNNHMQPEDLSVSTNLAHDPNNATNTPVWLEQGDYYFDDDFSVPFDTNLRDNIPDGTLDSDSVGMTVSLTTKLSTVPVSHAPDPSSSDSCICTPVDSGESGVASAQNVGLIHPVNHQLHLRKEGEESGQQRGGQFYEPEASSRFERSYQPETRTIREEEGHYNFEQRTTPDGAPPRSTGGSVMSANSGSTSWMQILMDQSCNPGLKALLNRAATAVDYKLAYTDPIPMGSSTSSLLRQVIQEKTNNVMNHSASVEVSGVSRSFSQGNLLTATGLAGLRNALNQATQYLPKSEIVEARSVGVTAAFADSAGASSCVSESGEAAIAAQTTTWAIKHGSRESLKRKTRRSQNVHNDKTPDLAVYQPTVTQPATVTTWRAAKQASGKLISWNQLKRTIKPETPEKRITAMRESRREQHTRLQDDLLHTEPYEQRAVTSEIESFGDWSTRPSIRSRSQPVSNDHHYMHRFSGTLLEIFMRARAEDTLFANRSLEESAFKETEPVCSDHRSSLDTACMPVVSRGYPHARGPLIGRPDRQRIVSEAEKHPLLRGDRILPQKMHSPNFSVVQTNRTTCNFGAQFSPRDVPPPVTNSNGTTSTQVRHSGAPIWSMDAPIRRPNQQYTTPYRPTSTGRPQSFGVTRTSGWPHSSPPPNDLPGMATCLTASAGPDSPYMAALRANCVADGYAAGWLGNPRASITYPGLGILSIPRPSRLTGAAFLSHTLPDLSFLGQAGAEEERKGTPTMPKRPALCACFLDRHHPTTNSPRDCCCTRCNCRSSSVGRHMSLGCCTRTRQGGKTRNRRELRAYTFNEVDTDSTSDQPAVTGRLGGKPAPVPDLVAGHTNGSTAHRIDRTSDSSNTTSDNNNNPAVQHGTATLCHFQRGVERSNSEPDLNSTMLLHSRSALSSRLTHTPPLDDDDHDAVATVTSSSQDGEYGNGWDEWNKSSSLYDMRPHRPKKSVSFGDKIRLLRLQSGRAARAGWQESPASPEPRVIPRNWGLYGQDTPLAEFNPRNSPGRDTNPAGDVPRQSDVDVRYHAMVNDVIKAVQETVAYFSTARNSSKSQSPAELTGSPRSTGNPAPHAPPEPLPYSTIAALGSAGRQPLLAVVSPLTVLLCDGLLPQSKLLFTSKPRTRLWQMVEESCRSGPLLNGVACRVLGDAVIQVKSLPSVTVEKAKFKAFICACLNSKALPIWLNVIIANEALLARYYCEGAFVRQCRSTQRGLYADLLTHLEQLLAYPFSLELAVEARKPLNDPNVSITGLRSANTTSPPKVAPRPGPLSTNRRPPLGSSTASQPITGRNRTSPPLPVSGNTTTTSPSTNVHHYPHQHLPGQRPMSGAPPRPGIPVRSTIKHNSLDESAKTSSSSGNPVGSNHSSINSSDAAATRTSQISTNKAKRGSLPPPSTTSAPPMRGRLKTALSTFRRSGPPSQPASSIPTGGVDPTAPPATTTRSGVGRRPPPPETAPRPRPMHVQDAGATPATAAKPTSGSKLKQPNTIVGGPSPR